MMRIQDYLQTTTDSNIHHTGFVVVIFTFYELESENMFNC